MDCHSNVEERTEQSTVMGNEKNSQGAVMEIEKNLPSENKKSEASSPNTYLDSGKTCSEQENTDDLGETENSDEQNASAIPILDPSEPKANEAIESVATIATGKPAVQKRLMSRSGWDAVPETDQFGAYMGEKQRKLREQYNAEASTLGITGGSNKSNSSKSAIKEPFKGVTVWVDGRTSPNRLEIRRLIMRGGGDMETYFTGKVTHVVADRLAAATQRRLHVRRDNATAKLHLVSASWVAQCAQESTRLPERRFPIPGTTDRSQKSISTMFPTKPRVQLKSKRGK